MRQRRLPRIRTLRSIDASYFSRCDTLHLARQTQLDKKTGSPKQNGDWLSFRLRQHVTACPKLRDRLVLMWRRPSGEVQTPRSEVRREGAGNRGVVSESARPGITSVCGLEEPNPRAGPDSSDSAAATTPARCGQTHDHKRHGTTTLFVAFNIIERESDGQLSTPAPRPGVHPWIEKAAPLLLPLHVCKQLLAQPGRTLLLPHHRQNDPPRNIPLCRSTGHPGQGTPHAM